MSKQISINKKMKEILKNDENCPLNAEVPNNLMIELTNICNLKCEMCYNKYAKRKKGFMPFDLYKKIVNQARELGIENIGLYTTGESFLHPKIFEFIKYAKQSGVKYVYVTTNGQALNDRKIKRILESGLDSIKFSIDAGDKERYESLKIGASWDKLVGIIKKLRTMRDDMNSNLRIFASFIVMKDNFNDLIKYNNTFNNLVDETMFTLVGNQGSQVNAESLYPKDIISKIQKLVLPREEWHPCSLLWNTIIITYEGYLTICCIDFENRLVYGDLNKQSLKSCWNNEEIKKFRKTHKFKQFEKLPMCYNCDAIKRNQKICVDAEIRKIFENEVPDRSKPGDI